MEQNGTSSSNPAPGRGAGSTTSAMVRDAARLRSVMGRGERESEDSTPFEEDRDWLIPEPEGMGAHHEADIDRDIAMPALGAGERATEPRRSAPEAPVRHEEDPAQQVTPTTLRAPSIPPRRRSPIASAEGSGEATTLRPVDALKELEERARIVAAAKKMAPPQQAPAQAQGGTRERVMAQGASHAYAMPEGERTTRTVEPEDIYYTKPRRPRRPRGRSLMGAVTVFAGTAIGIGLYAGGGDLLSRFFSNKNEGVMMENPAAVTERPQTLVPPPTASAMPSTGAEGMTDVTSGAGSTIDPAQAPSAASVVAEAPIPDKPIAAKPVIDKPVAESPAIAKPKPAENKAPAEKSSTMVNNLGTTSPAKGAAKPATKPVVNAGAAKSAKPVKPADAAAKSKPATKPVQPTTNATYVVQVRATSDEAEANRIARKLRAKGVKDVKVDLSQKNGTATYRVRYGAFASTAEAKSSAGRAGVGDAWVVKK